MRLNLPALILAATLLGCGGGGAPPPLEPLEPQTLALGLVPGNETTTFSVTILNRYPGVASVTEPGHDTGFATAPGQLPLELQPDESVEIDIVLTPWRSGLLTGDVIFALEAGEQSDVQITEVTATAEIAGASVQPAAIDFGEVGPGDSADATVTVTNTSLMSSVSFGAPVLPGASFAFTDALLPASLGPGESLQLTLRFSPDEAGSAAGFVQLPSDAANGPFSIFVEGSSSGQQVIDLGTADFQLDGDTEALEFDVPADAISFMIQATTSSGTSLGLRLLTGPGNREYENESLTGPYIWSVQEEIFNQQVPNTDRSEVQLVDGGGTYTLKLLRWSGGASSCDIKIFIERRPNPATRTLATLDLNVFLANGIAPTASTASSDSALQTVLGTVDDILAQQGIRLGDIDYYDVSSPVYDDVTWTEFPGLLQLSSAAEDTRLNLFFVRTAIGGGILGVSATLGGPVLNGTPVSGVMSLYSTSNPSFIGLVAAHEICHYLGLAHTAESDGSHDDITDTADCPASGTTSTAPCDVSGGGYLMHWQAVGGSGVTDGQGLVIRGHPHMAPRAADTGTLQGKPTLPPWIPVDPGVPANWCGTCQCLHGERVK